MTDQKRLEIDNGIIVWPQPDTRLSEIDQLYLRIDIQARLIEPYRENDQTLYDLCERVMEAARFGKPDQIRAALGEHIIKEMGGTLLEMQLAHRAQPSLFPDISKPSHAARAFLQALDQLYNYNNAAPVRQLARGYERHYKLPSPPKSGGRPQGIDSYTQTFGAWLRKLTHEEGYQLAEAVAEIIKILNARGPEPGDEIRFVRQMGKKDSRQQAKRAETIIKAFLKNIV